MRVNQGPSGAQNRLRLGRRLTWLEKGKWVDVPGPRRESRLKISPRAGVQAGELKPELLL